MPARFSDKIAAFVYFIGFEVVVYFLLSYLLFDEVPTNPDKAEITIVRDWNTFIYFVLLYAAIVIGAMLVLTASLPRPYKPLVMRYFWWSWLGLLVMFGVGFN